MPSIETSRMKLRLMSEHDLDYLAELNADPEVREFFPDGIQDKEQTRQRIKKFMAFYEEKGLPCFVMFDKESKVFIGRCGFGPIETGEIEVGYLIVRKFWGMGYASEALMALLEWAKKNINVEYIIAFAPILDLFGNSLRRMNCEEARSAEPECTYKCMRIRAPYRRSKSPLQ